MSAIDDLPTESQHDAKLPVKRRLFVDATITASYLYYGESKAQSIIVNGLVKVTEDELDNLDIKLIKDFAQINYRGHKYASDDVRYKVEYRAINAL